LLLRFSSSPPPRQPPSSPTRRSSDLRRESSSGALPAAALRSKTRVAASRVGNSMEAFTFLAAAGKSKPRPVYVLAGDEAFLKRRSEEHTSELQSPYELVCRLLLEKKN